MVTDVKIYQGFFKNPLNTAESIRHAVTIVENPFNS